MNKKNSSFITNLNYKDFLIILGLWYIIGALNYLLGQFSFEYTPYLTGFFHFLFILAGRFLYLALVLFYLISFYSISYKELGFKFNNFKKNLGLIFLLSFILLFGILIFINIPFSFNHAPLKFEPLYKITKPEVLVQSSIPLLIIFVSNLIIALSEEFILINIIYNFVKVKSNITIAIIITGLFYSCLNLQFRTGQIILNFIISFISIFLYQKTEKSIIYPTLFLAIFYSFYIVYIYGLNYIVF